MARLCRISLEEAQSLKSIGTSGAIRRLAIPHELLKRAVKEVLTNKQRLYAEKYFFENKTMVDIAKELGVNKSTVSRTITRAKLRLRMALKYTVRK